MTDQKVEQNQERDDIFDTKVLMSDNTKTKDLLGRTVCIVSYRKNIEQRRLSRYRALLLPQLTRT